MEELLFGYLDGPRSRKGSTIVTAYELFNTTLTVNFANQRKILAERSSFASLVVALALVDFSCLFE